MASQVIDFHAHVQPTAQAGLAFQREFGYNEPPRNGTPDELLPLMDRLGIERTLMAPWMPAQDSYDRRVAELARGGRLPGHREEAAARQSVIDEWRQLNQWAVDAVAQHGGRLMCLAGLDPILMGEDFVREEAADKLGKGACGLKIAPMFLRASPDDGRVAVVFELAREHGVFVLAQSGASGYRGAHAWGHPRYFDPVLRAFPEVSIVLAHLGVGAEEEVARLTAAYPNVYADTSSRLHLVGQPGQWSLEEAAGWLRRIGIERVLFGTNYPISDPARYVEVMEALPLSAGERAAVLRENAQRVLARQRRAGCA